MKAQIKTITGEIYIEVMTEEDMDGNSAFVKVVDVSILAGKNGQRVNENLTELRDRFTGKTVAKILAKSSAAIMAIIKQNEEDDRQQEFADRAKDRLDLMRGMR